MIEQSVAPDSDRPRRSPLAPVGSAVGGGQGAAEDGLSRQAAGVSLAAVLGGTLVGLNAARRFSAPRRTG